MTAIDQDHVDAHRDDVEEEATVGIEILLRGAEVGMAVIIGLLVVPPLAIFAVMVAVPLLVVGIVVGIFAAPYLLVRHVREHHRKHDSSVLAHGVRRLRAHTA
jgi:uncharacterized membrane-anchored protein